MEDFIVWQRAVLCRHCLWDVDNSLWGVLQLQVRLFCDDCDAFADSLYVREAARVASGMHVFAEYVSLLYGLHKVISCIKADFSLVKKVSLTDLKVALSKRMRGLLTWCIHDNS